MGKVLMGMVCVLCFLTVDKFPNAAFGADTLRNAVINNFRTVKVWTISGWIKYDNNPETPLNGLSVSAWQNGVQVGPACQTDNSGVYTLGSLPNGTYTLQVHSANPGGSFLTWQGVNSTDVALINKHIAGTQLLPTTPPTPRVAADVVAPHPDITAEDSTAVNMNRAGGWNAGSFDVDKWVFSGTTEVLGDIVINDSNVTYNMYALCSGDVNGTYVPVSGNK